MKQSFIIFIGLCVVTLLSCTKNPKSHEAEVTTAQEVTPVESEITYKVVENSVITWVGTKPTGRHNGTIAISDGTLAVKDGAIVGGSFTINMKEIVALDLKEDKENYNKLIGHLSSPDFFDVENNPTSEFVITEVSDYIPSKKTDNKTDPAFIVADLSHNITGNLTLRDTTLNITFPAKVLITESGITAQAKFNIDRTRWGVSYGDESAAVDKAKDKFIYNVVNIGFDLTAN